MATEGRMEDTGVTDAEVAGYLTTDPPAFEFFQAVRLLERLYPDRSAVGRFTDPTPGNHVGFVAAEACPA